MSISHHQPPHPHPTLTIPPYSIDEVSTFSWIPYVSPNVLWLVIHVRIRTEQQVDDLVM